MNIRKISLILIISLIAICIVSCNTRDANSKETSVCKCNECISFFVATDIHYLAPELTDKGEAFQKFMRYGDGKQLNYIDEIVEAFIYDIKVKKPDILIISGDLTNNGEKESHIELAKKLKRIEKAGTSVYVIPGNHDLKNPWARSFKGNENFKVDTITKRDFVKIYGDFGYDEAISRDKGSLSYLASPTKHLWILMLDTTKYKDNMVLGFPETCGYLSKETFEWIEECSNMAKEENAKLIAVMHHSLLDHCQVITKGFTLENNSTAVEVFQNCDIDLVLTGHIHIQDISTYEKDEKSIYDIATSALSVYPQQYGVLNYSLKNGYDYNTCRVDIENWANKKGIQDENLLNFKSYSKEAFMEQSYHNFYDKLLQMGKYTDEEMQEISKTLAMLNLNYYSGVKNTNIDEIKNTKGYKLLKESPPSLLKDYGIHMLCEKKTDNNKLHIPNHQK